MEAILFILKNSINIKFQKIKRMVVFALKDLESKIDENTVAICVCHSFHNVET